MKKSFTHELDQTIKITVEGKFVEAVSLEVFAPTNKVFSDVNIIDVEFNKSRAEGVRLGQEALKGLTEKQLETIKKMSAKEEKKEDSTPKPLELVSEMIKLGADMNKCVLALKNILSSGSKEKPMCLIDNVKMLKEHFDDLSVYDTKNILGLYIINFLDVSQNTSQTS